MEHSNLISVLLKDANVLDLYSGVGSFGVECVSRGAKKSTFVENDNKALEILKINIKQLQIEKRCEVFQTKTTSFINQLKKHNEYDIIFLDPPFSENFFIEELKMIKKSNLYKKNHIIIIHRENKSKDEISNLINVLTTKKYGRSKIIFGNFNLNIA